MTNRFEFTDPDGDSLLALPWPAGGPGPVVGLIAVPRKGKSTGVFIPLDRVEEVIAGIRDMARQAAGPAPEPVRPPYPSVSRWRVESLDPGSGEWAPGAALITRTAAVIKLDHLAKTAPAWRHDGSPVRRRIVRETTTYTVEEAGA